MGNEGYVLAIEPENKNFNTLLLNLRINRLKNVVPVKLAISDFEGKAPFFLKAHSFSHSLIDKTWLTPIIGTAEVIVTTLDKLLQKLNVKKVNLLKINVEGAEQTVLTGSKKFLSERRISKIVVALHPPFRQEAQKISRYLEVYGYTIKVSDDAKFLYAVLI